MQIFLCGDVMLGRGIDQILPFPSDPVLYEQYMYSAREYVDLAEAANGPIPRNVDFGYVWGDALDELSGVSPEIRIINLETAVTRSNDYWPKGINYRMNPANIPCLTAARIDCCCLANNHILDWGYAGLIETLEALQKAGIKTAGAGRNLNEAEAPAIMPVEGKGRVIVFSFGSVSSGVLRSWGATRHSPGVNLLGNLNEDTVKHIKALVTLVKKEGDIAICSVHWGGNWGYEIPDEQIQFAHQLIDNAGIDIVQGHSSHHAKGIEVYRGKLILYGCGNFLDDYEGISGYEEFRADLSLLYFPGIDPLTGKLKVLHMTPMQIKRFRLNHVYTADALWLMETLNSEGRKLGTRVEMRDGCLVLQMKSRVASG